MQFWQRHKSSCHMARVTINKEHRECTALKGAFLDVVQYVHITTCGNVIVVFSILWSISKDDNNVETILRVTKLELKTFSNLIDVTKSQMTNIRHSLKFDFLFSHYKKYILLICLILSTSQFNLSINSELENFSYSNFFFWKIYISF